MNPCDFYLWGRIEEEACKTSHSSLASLKRSITTTMANLNSAEVAKAVQAFRHRIEAMVEVRGGHIE